MATAILVTNDAKFEKHFWGKKIRKCVFKNCIKCFLQQRFATFTKLKKYFKNIEPPHGWCRDDWVSAARQACERQPILIPSAKYALEDGDNWGWICRPSFRQVTVSSWFTPSTSAFQKHQQQNWSISQGHLVQRNFSFGGKGQGISASALCPTMPSELGVPKISAPQLCLGPALILGMPYSLRITLHVKPLEEFFSVFRGHLTFMNFPSWKEEGSPPLEEWVGNPT